MRIIPLMSTYDMCIISQGYLAGTFNTFVTFAIQVDPLLLANASTLSKQQFLSLKVHLNYSYYVHVL